jgi:hypothetical protein
MNSSRAQRRSMGKRQLRREAYRDTVRILELVEQGYSVQVIADTVRMPESFVRLVLEKAREATEGGGDTT